MAEQGDLQAPAWLQRNWTPKEPFDPTPWLQERYRRQVEQAKLPLELQHMELANKAQTLAIEHQGMLNDQVNQDLDLYAQEQPALKDWLSQNAKTPGIAPPAVRSKQAVATVLGQQRMLAESEYGKADQLNQIAQTKQAAEILEYLGVDVPRGPNGKFDQAMIANLAPKATEAKFQQELKKRPDMSWHERLAVANQAAVNARAVENATIRREAAADRRQLNKGVMELRKNAQELAIDKVMQKDADIMALRERREEAADLVAKYKRSEADPAWFGYGMKKVAKERKEQEDLLKEIDKKLSQREDTLRKRYHTEVLGEEAPEEGTGDEEEAPASTPTTDFDYDPTAKTLVKPK